MMGGYAFFLAETSKLFLVQFCPQDFVIWLYSSKLLLAVLFFLKKKKTYFGILMNENDLHCSIWLL